jgi:hypothetical protein
MKLKNISITLLIFFTKTNCSSYQMHKAIVQEFSDEKFAAPNLKKICFKVIGTDTVTCITQYQQHAKKTGNTLRTILPETTVDDCESYYKRYQEYLNAMLHENCLSLSLNPATPKVISIETLLKQKADPNLHSALSTSLPISYPCLPAVVIAALLNAKADPNGKYELNQTPLLSLINVKPKKTTQKYAENLQKIQLLVDAKADIHYKISKHNLSPLDCAKLSADDAVIAILLKDSESSINQSKLNKTTNCSMCLIQ